MEGNSNKFNERLEGDKFYVRYVELEVFGEMQKVQCRRCRSVQRVGYKNLKFSRDVSVRYIDFGVINKQLVIEVTEVDESCRGRKC